MRHILIATLGSLGDLYPFLSLGCELQARGACVTIATSEDYRSRIEQAGLGFRHMRPDMPDPSAYQQLMDRRQGPEMILRHLVADIDTSYADLFAATADVDVLIGSQVAFAVPIVAETRRLPWASGVLQPMGLMSVFDPPVIPQARLLSALLHPFGQVFGRPLVSAARAATRRWMNPIDVLRRRLGLPALSEHPLFDGQHSPELVLAMFPRVFAARQPDWPSQVEITGTAFWDQGSSAQDTSSDLRDFLNQGAAPIVFTLGSAAVHAAGAFYRESFKAAQAIGARAIFLTGDDFVNRAQLPRILPSDMLALRYAPHRAVFRAASVIVHQGGIGTLSQALRAGKPMLVVPYSHDQPDNAARAERLGVSRTVFADHYSANRAIRELESLLNDFQLVQRAEEIGRTVRADGGALDAADAIEAWLDARPTPIVYH